MLLAFRAPAPVPTGQKPPARLLVAKWGRNETVKGPFIVNETTQRLLPVMQRQLGFDTIAVDFEHNTVPGTPEYSATQEPRTVAAATGKLSVVPGEGIYLDVPQWTPEGIASVTGGHHPDLSPAIKTNAAGEIVFVHSVALCRQGACMDLHVFAAGLDAAQLRTFSTTLSTLNPQPSTTHMDYKALLLLLLGLEANSTDATITTAAQAFAGKIDAALKQGSSITTLSASLKTLGESVAALQLAHETAERDAITATALRDGKLIPLTAHKLGLADFKTFVGELTAGVVPLDKRTPDAVKTFSANVGAGRDHAAEEVRQNLGISKETWAKHNPA